MPYHNGAFEGWAKEATDSAPFHYADGVTIWMSPIEVAPDDDWLEQNAALSDSADGNEQVEAAD